MVLTNWNGLLSNRFLGVYYAMTNKVSLFIHILSAAPAVFRSAEEDQFIEMTSDSTLRLRFTAQTLCEFWLGVEREYPLIGQRAVCILLPFATSYLREMGFSAVASLKTKYRSQLNIEHELRVALSSLQPRFEKMCNAKQAHCSHQCRGKTHVFMCCQMHFSSFIF